MAGEFTETNKTMMTSALRRPPSEGELYAAHFLGAQGAVDLIRLASVRPEANAAAQFPDAAAANRSIFYSRGKPLGAAQVLAKITNKHDTSAPNFPTTPNLPVETNTPLVAQGGASFFTNAAPTRVAAPGNDGAVFHSMFSTAQRAPVSSSVRALWSDLTPAASAGGGGAVTKPPLDLSSFVTHGGGKARGPGNI
jgi:hypothetical protein